MQNLFLSAALNFGQGHFVQQSNRIAVELTPAGGIEITEQAAGIMVPTPPQIASESPKPFLRGSDEAIERASLADHWRHLGSSLREHMDFILSKYAGLNSLNDKNTLQNAAVNQRDSQKRLISVFARVTEILEPRMVSSLVNRHRPHLFRYQARKTFVESHAERADALRTQSEGSGQDEIIPVRFQQIRRTDIGVEPLGDQRHNIHQSLDWFALLPCEIGDFFQGEYMAVIALLSDLAHFLNTLFFRIQFSNITAPFVGTDLPCKPFAENLIFELDIPQ
jgi:hypothetical protein